MAYGVDSARASSENKRAVEEKYIGPAGEDRS